MDSEHKKRGRGNCPKCNEEYFNRYKPKECLNCGEFIGGSHTSAKKPENTGKAPSAVRVTESIVSVATTKRGNRCFVTRDESGSWMCLHSACKEKRAMHINSVTSKQFTCQHINAAVDNTKPPVRQLYVADEALTNYPCSNDVNEKLASSMQYTKDNGFAPVVQISETKYAIYADATASNPLGFCHLDLAGQSMSCSGKDCRGFMARGKHKRVKCNCVHMHMYCLVNGKREDTEEAAETQRPTEVQQLPGEDELRTENKVYSARDYTIQTALARQLPYNYEKETMEAILENDINTWKGIPNGWPKEFVPSYIDCQNCGSPLSPPKSHSGKKGNCFLITELNPFKIIDIKVKTCSNSTCQAMHQAVPFELGLFNISDKLMVSFDILLEIREFFKTGHPLTNAIHAKLAMMQMKCKESPSYNELQYIEDLLYNGFLMFEAITQRDLNDVVCGICGVCPEVCLGDGNEKNCCSNAQIAYKKTETANERGLMTLDELLGKIKRRLVEKVVYTRNKDPFEIGIAEMPLIIPSAVANSTIFNTEMDKKSIYLTSEQEGDPAILHHIITNENLDIENLNNINLENLTAIAKRCNIKTNAKSKVALIGDIYSLYSSILVGLSPCHTFSKVPGKTGGFYHFVCRHGCTVASKFLALTESVRDAADIYMSLKYPPIVFINDTPCGFVRHVECRAPEAAKELWGERSGCFEKPTLGKEPNDNHNVPSIVPPEYQATNKTRTDTCQSSNSTSGRSHSITNTSGRYILGDRFHASSNPHKSPLCQFHDINLCAQANTITTSVQECQNNSKNIRRLRSSCQQNFGTHMFFNYLMDYYQNEQIIKSQQINLCKDKKDNEVLVRDELLRFKLEEL